MEELQATIEMLRRAYPSGLSPSLVLPLARALYDHMSDRQLAAVISHFTGEDAAVALNRVYASTYLDLKSAEVSAVVAVLRAHGYDQWCAES